MRTPRRRLLPELARARRACLEPEPWIPTEEEKAAIADGSLIVIPLRGGPVIYMNLARPEPPRNQ